MKNRFLFMMFGVVLTGNTALAGEMFQSRAYTPYVTGGIGVGIVQQTDFNFATGVDVGNDYENGFLAYGEVGFNFGKVGFIDNLKIGFELSRSKNDIDVHTIPALGGEQPNSTGDIVVTTTMANMYHEFDMDTRIVPYYGVGLGITLLDTSNYGVQAAPRALNDFTAAPSYSLMAGLNYISTKNLDFGIRYRYLATLGAEWTGSGPGADRRDLEYQNHSLSANLTYNFDFR